jgi:hypothetical protein
MTTATPQWAEGTTKVLGRRRNLQSRYDLEIETDRLGNRLREEVSILARAG